MAHLDQDPLLRDAHVLVQRNDLMSFAHRLLCRTPQYPDPGWKDDGPVSKENFASTSVDTRPGTILRISEPN